MKYKVLEGIATADVAYEIYGKTLEELFTNAAEAVEETMVDLASVESRQNVRIKMSQPKASTTGRWASGPDRPLDENVKLEYLLLDFLNELLFYKDSKQMLFSRFELKINQQDARRYQLDAKLGGEKIDPAKHKLRTDVKAVTRHLLEVKKTKNHYRAIIVLDI